MGGLFVSLGAFGKLTTDATEITDFPGSRLLLPPSMRSETNRH